MDKNTKLQIIIVDDSKDDHFFTTEALRDFENISFLHFYDGEQFINYLKNKENDSGQDYHEIVVLDINMPKLTGFEIYEKIQKDGLIANMKFFIFTTTLSDRDLEKGRRLGLNCHLKPFSINGFSLLLERAIKELL